MARAFTPQIVTANDLLEGDAIYLTATGDWSRAHGDAALARSEDEARRLLETASRQQDRVVGAYLADAAVSESGKPVPVHFREAFRTRGPSNYAHGKQAEV